MKIHWKYLATTDGYKSLKAAYIRDLHKSLGSKCPVAYKLKRKDELVKLFQWVISRAKHYACHTGKAIDQVLNEWEEKRNYWWINFYQDSNQPKFHSSSLKPRRSRNRNRKQNL